MYYALRQRDPGGVVAPRSHECGGGVIVRVFKLDIIWDELVVETWEGEGLSSGQLVV